MNVYGGAFPLLLPLLSTPSPLLTSFVPSSIPGREKEKKRGGESGVDDEHYDRKSVWGKDEERDNTREKRTLYNYEAFSFSLSPLAPLECVQNKIHHPCGTDGHNGDCIHGSSISA